MAQARKVRRKPAGPPRRPLPGWAWLLTGMLVGLAAAAVFYLQGVDRMGQDPGWLTRGETEAPASAGSSSPNGDRATGAPATPASERSRFQFYELLPRDEVQIPRAAPHRTPPPAAPPAPATPPAPPPQAAPADRVILQTGSFRQYAQADEMKARLALLGLAANVREARVNGQTFHRVYVGPLTGEAEIRRILERLRNENIEALRLPAP